MSKCAEFKFDLICEIIFDKFFPGLTWVRIPVSQGKNLSKMLSQIRLNLNSAHLDIIYT